MLKSLTGKIGMTMMMASLPMLNPALAYQNLVKLMHVPRPLLTLLSKANPTGEHWKMDVITEATVKATTSPIITQQIALKHLQTPKTRR